MKQAFHEIKINTKGQGLYNFTSQTISWLNKQNIINERMRLISFIWLINFRKKLDKEKLIKQAIRSLDWTGLHVPILNGHYSATMKLNTNLSFFRSRF